MATEADTQLTCPDEVLAIVGVPKECQNVCFSMIDFIIQAPNDKNRALFRLALIIFLHKNGLFQIKKLLVLIFITMHKIFNPTS